MIRSQLTAQLVTLTVVLTLGSLHTTYVAQPINGLAQEKERTIKRTKFFNEPIKILEIKVAGKSVRDEGTVNHRGKIANVSDIKFTAENDWLKGKRKNQHFQLEGADATNSRKARTCWTDCASTKKRRCALCETFACRLTTTWRNVICE